MGKILFLKWECYGQEFVIREFEENGYTVTSFTFPAGETNTHTESGAAMSERLLAAIFADKYEFVFSFNFFPLAAIVCQACKLKYVSWVYDNALTQLYSETIGYGCNYVFLFDWNTFQKFVNKGISTVYYLPMAADTLFYDTVVSNEEQRGRYGADVSFVGSLYNERYDAFSGFEHLDAYTKGYLDALVLAQKDIYGCNFLESALTPRVVAGMARIHPLERRVNGMETAEWLYANFYLARKVTAIERTEIMKLLSERFAVKLFTDEDTAYLPKLENMGKADYYSEAPHVFKNSKINLNITLRSITSAIPLRGFDIMGCCGFLLTNFQADFLNFFIPDEDFVFYESQADLADKVEYYLEHDDKREGIARNGYEKVKAGHTYGHRVRELLGVVLNEERSELNSFQSNK